MQDAISAVLFDLDGVVTDTAEAHSAAWKRLFDDFLRAAPGKTFQPFNDSDYRNYVDGKPRYDGVKSFLDSRHIELPWGDEEDRPDTHTICGLGNRKNGYFNDWLEENRVRSFPGTLAFIHTLKCAGVHTTVFSSSRNAGEVLENAGVLDLFDIKVDGSDLSRLDLPGKPDPAILDQTARRLDLAPRQCAVVEDAISGIEAGLSGGYGLIIGIDRSPDTSYLPGTGAHIVVADAAELRLTGDRRITVKTLKSLPNARDCEAHIRQRIASNRLVVFLDYDGTLTPIVEDPAQARLDKEMRQAIAALAEHVTVAIVSGRDIMQLKSFVPLDSVYLIGSHGFEITAPGGDSLSEQGSEFLPHLDRAEETLRKRLGAVPGTNVERKKFAIAAHYRQVAEPDVERTKEIVGQVAKEEPRLKAGHGKKVLRLQPGIDWDKGRAVELLLERLQDKRNLLPLFVGDDVTDEDAFRTLAGKGITIAVRDGDRRTAADYAVSDVIEVENLLRWLCRTAAEAS